MKKLITVCFALLVSLSTSSVFAGNTVEFNRTITKIGVQGNVAYIAVSPALALAGGCLFDILYIADTSISSGKALYATLLTAYSQGKPLSRVDYFNATSGTQCFVSLLEVS